MSTASAHIKNSDMNDDMQQYVVQSAAKALEQATQEKDIASFIKKAMDAKYGATWHVVVGRNFGSYVTHESGGFIYFYLNERAYLIYKSG